MAAVPHRCEQDANTVIAETPGVLGGYPHIGDTRISVRAVVEVARLHGGVEAVAAYYPQLTRAQIDAALMYYAAHPARVDEDIETSHRADAMYAPYPTDC